MAASKPVEPIRWGRVFAALLVAGLVLEATIQTFVYRWSGARYRSLSPYRWSGYGFVRNNPELSSNAYQINANGFRNLATFTREKPPRTLRFMVLGGSVMYSGLGGTPIEGIARVDSSSTIAQYIEQELRADPELAGLDVEVLNAAVNFNRINEVSEAYLGEWASWDPDFVIYGASGNNFAYAPPKGWVYGRRWTVMTTHEWEPEFQRIANERTPTALAERGVSTLEGFFATVGVARKGLTFAMDTGFGVAEAKSAALGIRYVPPPTAAWEPAPFEEYDAYIDEYLGYADAMVAVARRHHQALAFFWEYPLAHLGGIKPMGPIEQRLYQQNRRPHYALDTVYDDRARAAVHRYCDENGVSFLDPIERLRTHDGLVYIDYLHYTREGNAFMARFMVDSLRDAIHRRAAQVKSGAR